MIMRFFSLSKKKAIFIIIGVVLYLIAFLYSMETYIVCDISSNCPTPTTLVKFLALITLPNFFAAEIFSESLDLGDAGVVIGPLILSLLIWYLISCVVFNFLIKK